MTIAGCALGLAALCPAQGQAPDRFVVAGYVFPRNTVLQPDRIDARGLTRINYAFAGIQDGRMGPGAGTDEQNFALLTGLRKANPSLTVLVSVGGWLGSAGFSDVALTAQSRKAFVDSAVDFLKRYGLDGLDVDWEYPGMPGAGNPFRAEDKQNFTLLLEDLRGRFKREKSPSGRRLILTIAAGGSNNYLMHTEMKKAQRLVDAVNLMAYDYDLPSADAITGHNAPLFTNPEAPKSVSADASVRAFEQAGVPARKIVLGLPFYGYVWGDVPDRNHGLFQPGKPAAGSFASFSSIQSTMLGRGFVRYWDDAASAPYLYSEEKQEFVSYEDAESMAIKCNYVTAHKLGGVMFWEYSEDPSGALLQTIDRVLRQSPASAQ
ncbi:MAG: glycoside hydrolase family 18 protein [Terracidiphilus sp.]